MTSDLGAQDKEIKEDFGPLELTYTRREETRGGVRLVGARRGEVVYIEETKKAGVRHVRKPDFLEKWRKAKNITLQEEAAGREFMKDYRLSHMQPNYATGGSIDRVDTSPGQDDGDDVSKIDADKRLAKVYGVIGRRGEDIANHVLGQEWTITEYAKRIGANDHVTKGILVGVLGCLAKHYRLI
jgi:hypothetical protein